MDYQRIIEGLEEVEQTEAVADAARVVAAMERIKDILNDPSALQDVLHRIIGVVMDLEEGND